MALRTLTSIHNQMVLDDLEEGDLIEIDRCMYSHWAIYNGNEEVIHLTGQEDEANGIPLTANEVLFTFSGVKSDKAAVKVEPFWDVVGDCKARRNNQHDCTHAAYSPTAILRRARSRIGPVDYNMIWSNCEHFVSWCRYGENISKQADKVLTGVVVAGAAVIVGGLFMELFRKKDG